MRVKNYIFQNFAQIFFPIFLVLFFIASVIVFIRISSVTFVVKISFFELFALYFYTMPLMVFFVIPITFFIASTLSLSKLCYDYELPVLFSLGLNPQHIVRIFAPIAFLASFSLLILSLILTPLSDKAYRSFIDSRKSSISLNLKSGEFGQRIGEWLVYVKSSGDDIGKYKDIVLLSFSKEGGLILAHDAHLYNNQSNLEALLRDGMIYRSSSNEVEKITFDKLILRNNINSNNNENLSIFEYWNIAFSKQEEQKKRLRNLSLYILLSISPIISLYFYLLLGIKNPRYQKNYTTAQIMLIIGIFYGFIYAISNYLPIVGTILFPIAWFVAGYIAYKKTIGKFY